MFRPDSYPIKFCKPDPDLTLFKKPDPDLQRCSEQSDSKILSDIYKELILVLEVCIRGDV